MVKIETLSLNIIARDNRVARINSEKPERGFYQEMTFRCWKNLPVSFCGASVASQTIPLAPCSGDSDAFEPPMSVRTQPGQTEFTANFGNADASWTVTP